MAETNIIFVSASHTPSHFCLDSKIARSNTNKKRLSLGE